jgi:hypothetical protein
MFSGWAWHQGVLQNIQSGVLDQAGSLHILPLKEIPSGSADTNTRYIIVGAEQVACPEKQWESFELTVSYNTQ